MKKIQEWIQQRTKKFRLWLYWKNLTLKDLFMICFSFLWLFGFIIFTAFALMSCASVTEDTAYYEAADDDEFVNNWWSLETDNLLLNQVVDEGNCYRFYEYTSEYYGDWRKMYGRDSLEEGSYHVADWERAGVDSMFISEKYELIYEKTDNGCYLLQAHSSLMNAEGEACPCEQ